MREASERATLDGQQAMIQCSQQDAKLRGEALLLAFQYMNLDLIDRMKNSYGNAWKRMETDRKQKQNASAE
jgi:hypothetical protein